MTSGRELPATSRALMDVAFGEVPRRAYTSAQMQRCCQKVAILTVLPTARNNVEPRFASPQNIVAPKAFSRDDYAINRL